MSGYISMMDSCEVRKVRHRRTSQHKEVSHQVSKMIIRLRALIQAMPDNDPQKEAFSALLKKRMPPQPKIVKPPIALQRSIREAKKHMHLCVPPMSQNNCNCSPIRSPSIRTLPQSSKSWNFVQKWTRWLQILLPRPTKATLKL